MFDLISPNAQALTMSSREIAELVESRHDSVKRTIETLVEKGVIAFPQTVEKATGGRPSVEYVFSGAKGKRDSLIVVAQLCPEFTARIVDRWQQLEAQVAAPVFDPRSLSKIQILEMAIQSEQERLALAHKVEELEPKAEALDRIAESDGEMTLTVAAKVLQMKPRQLTEWMRNNRWLYKRPGSTNNVAYQDKIDAGLMRHKMVNIRCRDGSELVSEQALVTNLGVERLARQLRMH